MSDGQLQNVDAKPPMYSKASSAASLISSNNWAHAGDDNIIRARTKRDVTDRLRPSAKSKSVAARTPFAAAAGESLARAFLELARHRLPGAP